MARRARHAVSGFGKTKGAVHRGSYKNGFKKRRELNISQSSVKKLTSIYRRSGQDGKNQMKTALVDGRGAFMCLRSHKEYTPVIGLPKRKSPPAPVATDGQCLPKSRNNNCWKPADELNVDKQRASLVRRKYFEQKDNSNMSPASADGHLTERGFLEETKMIPDKQQDPGLMNVDVPYEQMSGQVTGVPQVPSTRPDGRSRRGRRKRRNVTTTRQNDNLQKLGGKQDSTGQIEQHWDQHVEFRTEQNVTACQVVLNDCLDSRSGTVKFDVQEPARKKGRGHRTLFKHRQPGTIITRTKSIEKCQPVFSRMLRSREIVCRTSGRLRNAPVMLRPDRKSTSAFPARRTLKRCGRKPRRNLHALTQIKKNANNGQCPTESREYSGVQEINDVTSHQVGPSSAIIPAYNLSAIDLEANHDFASQRVMMLRPYSGYRSIRGKDKLCKDNCKHWLLIQGDSPASLQKKLVGSTENVKRQPELVDELDSHRIASLTSDCPESVSAGQATSESAPQNVTISSELNLQTTDLQITQERRRLSSENDSSKEVHSADSKERQDCAELEEKGQHHTVSSPSNVAESASAICRTRIHAVCEYAPKILMMLRPYTRYETMFGKSKSCTNHWQLMQGKRQCRPKRDTPMEELSADDQEGLPDVFEQEESDAYVTALSLSICTSFESSSAIGQTRISDEIQQHDVLGEKHQTLNSLPAIGTCAPQKAEIHSPQDERLPEPGTGKEIALAAVPSECQEQAHHMLHVGSQSEKIMPEGEARHITLKEPSSKPQLDEIVSEPGTTNEEITQAAVPSECQEQAHHVKGSQSEKIIPEGESRHITQKEPSSKPQLDETVSEPGTTNEEITQAAVPSERQEQAHHVKGSQSEKIIPEGESRHITLKEPSSKPQLDETVSEPGTTNEEITQAAVPSERQEQAHHVIGSQSEKIMPEGDILHITLKQPSSKPHLGSLDLNFSEIVQVDEIVEIVSDQLVPFEQDKLPPQTTSHKLISASVADYAPKLLMSLRPYMKYLTSSVKRTRSETSHMLLVQSRSKSSERKKMDHQAESTSPAHTLIEERPDKHPLDCVHSRTSDDSRTRDIIPNQSLQICDAKEPQQKAVLGKQLKKPTEKLLGYQMNFMSHRCRADPQKANNLQTQGSTEPTNDSSRTQFSKLTEPDCPPVKALPQEGTTEPTNDSSRTQPSILTESDCPPIKALPKEGSTEPTNDSSRTQPSKLTESDCPPIKALPQEGTTEPTNDSSRTQPSILTESDCPPIKALPKEGSTESTNDSLRTQPSILTKSDCPPIKALPQEGSTEPTNDLLRTQPSKLTESDCPPVKALPQEGSTEPTNDSLRTQPSKLQESDYPPIKALPHEGQIKNCVKSAEESKEPEFIGVPLNPISKAGKAGKRHTSVTKKAASKTLKSQCRKSSISFQPMRRQRRKCQSLFARVKSDHLEKMSHQGDLPRRSKNSGDASQGNSVKHLSSTKPPSKKSHQCAKQVILAKQNRLHKVCLDIHVRGLSVELHKIQTEAISESSITGEEQEIIEKKFDSSDAASEVDSKSKNVDATGQDDSIKPVDDVDNADLFQVQLLEGNGSNCKPLQQECNIPKQSTRGNMTCLQDSSRTDPDEHVTQDELPHQTFTAVGNKINSKPKPEGSLDLKEEIQQEIPPDNESSESGPVGCNITKQRPVKAPQRTSMKLRKKDKHFLFSQLGFQKTKQKAIDTVRKTKHGRDQNTAKKSQTQPVKLHKQTYFQNGDGRGKGETEDANATQTTEDDLHQTVLQDLTLTQTVPSNALLPRRRGRPRKHNFNIDKSHPKTFKGRNCLKRGQARPVKQDKQTEAQNEHGRVAGEIIKTEDANCTATQDVDLSQNSDDQHQKVLKDDTSTVLSDAIHVLPPRRVRRKKRKFSIDKSPSKTVMETQPVKQNKQTDAQNEHGRGKGGIVKTEDANLIPAQDVDHSQNKNDLQQTVLKEEHTSTVLSDAVLPRRRGRRKKRKFNIKISPPKTAQGRNNQVTETQPVIQNKQTEAQNEHDRGAGDIMKPKDANLTTPPEVEQTLNVNDCHQTVLQELNVTKDSDSLLPPRRGRPKKRKFNSHELSPISFNSPLKIHRGDLPSQEQPTTNHLELQQDIGAKTTHPSSLGQNKKAENGISCRKKRARRTFKTWTRGKKKRNMYKSIAKLVERKRLARTCTSLTNSAVQELSKKIHQLIPGYSSPDEEEFTLEDFCCLATLEEAVEWDGKGAKSEEITCSAKKTKCKNASSSSTTKSRSKRSSRSPEGSYWDCSVCTYRNKAEAFKCAMCDVRKGTSTRKPRLNAQLVAQQQAQQNLSPLIHVKPVKTTPRGSAPRKGGTSKKPRPRLKNVDRSTAISTEVVVNNVPVIITEFKEKSHTRTTVDSDEASADRTNGNVNGL